MNSIISIYVESEDKKDTIKISENDNELSRFLFKVNSLKNASGKLILSSDEISLFDFETEDDEATSTTKLINATRLYKVIHKLHLAILTKEILDLDGIFRHPQFFYDSFNNFYKIIKTASDNNAKVQIIDFYS